MTKFNEKFIKLLVLIFLIFGCLNFFVLVYVYFVNGHINIRSDIEFVKLSSFGTFISGVSGTLFTLCATLLIWLTYKTQKEELAETIQIAKGQKQIFDDQQSENTFFNLLEYFRRLLNSFKWGNGSDKKEGAEYFSYIIIRSSDHYT